MTGKARSALVFQGGGALGAYELSAAKALYEIPKFAPDLIAGVSIGAITAALLARPGKGRKPLEALQAFWQRVTVNAPFVPPAFRPYEAFFGNGHFASCAQTSATGAHGILPSWDNTTHALQQIMSAFFGVQFSGKTAHKCCHRTPVEANSARATCPPRNTPITH
jgi:predicted acylesterase/phospholipase RssA